MRQLTLVSLLLCVVAPTVSAADRISNRWKPDQVLHVEAGRLVAGPPQGDGAPWEQIPVEGSPGYVRLRSTGDGDRYVHIEYGPVEAGTVQPGWYSAMWSLENVPGSAFVRIRNRWKPDVCLHIERGILEAGPVEPGWHSAMWRIDSVATAEPSPPAPTPVHQTATAPASPRAKPAGGVPPGCGGEGQPPCTVTPAILVGPKPRGCPAGSRSFPLVDGGTCWRCPAGMQHTVFDVKGPTACESPAGERVAPATYVGKSRGFDCPNGGRHDFIDGGTCWSCPEGLGRTLLPVNGPRACAGAVPARRAPAAFAGSLACPPGTDEDAIDGGTCWSCPDGYERSWSSVKAKDACTSSVFAGLGAGRCADGHVEIRGTCRALGRCGGVGGRPCELGERAPSCDPGLKENFKRNVCEPLAPGETPFVAGLASLAEYYGSTVRTVCKQTLGDLRFDEPTPLGIGANCAKDIFTGAGCEFLATALGAKTADTVATVARAGPAFESFRDEVDRAYATPPCSRLGEKVAPATHHGPAPPGGPCAAGLFRDPNGSCYSCPAGHTRTLNPVGSPAACVDKPGGELARSACSVYQAATRGFAESAACTAEILTSGVFLDQPIGFEGASRAYCTATGELVYAIFFLLSGNDAPDRKARELESALVRFLAAAKNAAADAGRYGRIGLKARGVGVAGQEWIRRFDDLQRCRLP